MSIHEEMFSPKLVQDTEIHFDDIEEQIKPGFLHQSWALIMFIITRSREVFLKLEHLLSYI